MAAKKKAATGRKPYYEEKNIAAQLDAIRGWSQNGSTDKDIMRMLGVAKQTFYKWMKEKEDFAKAVKEGRDKAVGELLNSAHRQTQGYYVTERKPQKVKQIEVGTDGKTYETERIEIVPVERYVEPTPSVTIFMLKNRAGFRDRVENMAGTPDEFAAMDAAALDKEIERLEKVSKRS